ncbi:MAG: NUDIX hydrolase [Pseudobutyrivibrio sp.]|nr:NUDIX hydrolase [Pseudobutyrivibrio sp.]
MELKDKNGLTEAEFLAQYDPGDYPRPSVTVDMMVLGTKKDLSGLRILLIKRGGHPYLNSWALPGGFVHPDETCYEAAKRELKEETGIKDVFLEQVYTFSKPDRDPRTRVMSVAYIALTPFTLPVKGGDDALEAAWFDFEFTDNRIHIFNDDIGVDIVYYLSTKRFKNGHIKYPNLVPTLKSKTKLAFDHVEIIIEAMKKIRREIEYTDLPFSMAEVTFTLPDLQVIYELLLGHKLYKANFRIMVADRIEALGEKSKSIVGRRMSELYILK